jgi:hypothetical protein
MSDTNKDSSDHMRVKGKGDSSTMSSSIDKDLHYSVFVHNVSHGDMLFAVDAHQQPHQHSAAKSHINNSKSNEVQSTSSSTSSSSSSNAINLQNTIMTRAAFNKYREVTEKVYQLLSAYNQNDHHDNSSTHSTADISTLASPHHELKKYAVTYDSERLGDVWDQSDVDHDEHVNSSEHKAFNEEVNHSDDDLVEASMSTKYSRRHNNMTSDNGCPHPDDDQRSQKSQSSSPLKLVYGLQLPQPVTFPDFSYFRVRSGNDYNVSQSLPSATIVAMFIPLLSIIIPSWLKQIESSVTLKHDHPRHDISKHKKLVYLLSGCGTPWNASDKAIDNTTRVTAQLIQLYLHLFYPTIDVIILDSGSSGLFHYDANVVFVNTQLRPRIDTHIRELASVYFDKWSTHFDLAISLTEGT